MGQRGRIDYRLECRAGLPFCIEGPVEVTPQEIIPSDEGTYKSGLLFYRDQSALCLRFLFKREVE